MNQRHGEEGRSARRSTRAAVRMIWTDMLFIHWPVPLDMLRPLVPAPLEIDRFDGQAWVGLIPFSMPLVQPWWIPSALSLPGVTAFHECNVRTYVRHGEETGVYFFSLDASSRAAAWAARRFWHLAYHHARIGIERTGTEVRYHLRRRDGAACMSCRWETGEPLPPAEPGDLPHFLTERYALYCAHHDFLLRGIIRHPQWRLRRAELLELDDGLEYGLLTAAGIRAQGPPLVFAGDPLHVDAWNLESVH